MQAALEALLYTAGEAGISLTELTHLLGRDASAIRQQLEEMTLRLAHDEQRGLMLELAGDRYYLLTKPALSDVVQKFFAGPPAQGLSQAALEVLAIVAYQQPLTRIEIDEIRGVQSSGALATLASRQLIEEAGRKDVPGRPILYQTTPVFLDYFGLTGLDQLPPLGDNTSNEDLLAAFNQSLETEASDGE